MILEKKFTFEAAHLLEVAGWSPEKNREVFGKCNNLHGHSYKLYVRIIGEVQHSGMVINFTDMKEHIKKEITDRYDHSYLNDFSEFKGIPTTAENILLAIKERLTANWPYGHAHLRSLHLFETENSSALWEA